MNKITALSDNDSALEIWEFEMNWCNCALFPIISELFFLSCSLLVSTFVARAMDYSGVVNPDKHFPYFPCQVPYKMRQQQLQAVAGRGNADGEWTGIYRHID